MILNEIPDFKQRIFFTCGPPKLVDNMMKLLEEIDVDKEKIMKENFPGY